MCSDSGAMLGGFCYRTGEKISTDDQQEFTMSSTKDIAPASLMDNATGLWPVESN